MKSIVLELLRLRGPAAGLWLICLLVPPAFAAAPAASPPSPEVLEEAKAIVARMKANERGPYRRVVWFCNDGTRQPAVPYACRERGGGHQHAEYSDDRERLAQLGWPVGTIFTAATFEELFDAGRRNLRLRQLPLERHLVQLDDGWVLRRARFYRGRVQVEDEEEFGDRHLIRLLEDPVWVDANLLLVRELVRTIPHHGGTDRTRRVRRLAEVVAAQDPSFQALRIKIHGAPDVEDIGRVDRWRADARARGGKPAAIAQADSLSAELEQLLGPAGRRARMETARRTLERRKLGKPFAARLAGHERRAASERISDLSAILGDLRPALRQGDPRWRLTLLDLSLDLEAELRQLVFDLLRSVDPPRRDEALRVAADLTRAACGLGLLSERERDTVVTPLVAAADRPEQDAREYVRAVEDLRRVGSWAIGTVRYTFAEPLVWFSALEPLASRFPDDLLRASVLLPLGELARAIALDAEGNAGTVHRVFGQSFTGLLGLNPGVAVGRLRIVEEAEGHQPAVRPDEIVVLPTAVSELLPVAGILSLSEGNLLSHVQLLARNLGIPNASLSPFLGARLREAEGREVVLAVGRDGRVVLELLEGLDAAAREVLRSGSAAEAAAIRVRAPRPDLGVTRPIPLAELNAGLAGRVVGPKAANLGELARMFPGRVAPAVALPFGVFASHLRAGEAPIDARLRAVIARHRDGALDDAGLYAALDTLRSEIEELTIDPATSAVLDSVLAREFRSAPGMFVRSDTNVEDLPQFTGAGLNRTVPHVIGADARARATARVWASPFTRRAMSWRDRVLEDPEEVYVSVLYMQSVPAEKSGVLVTADLLGGDDGCTVATAWGIGGAVDNETAETLVLRADGSRQVIGEAKAPYRRVLAPKGGIAWDPAPMGAVLDASECAVLMEMVADLKRLREPIPGPDGRPLPWDVEFGFVDGQLQLFQIRPLVQPGSARAQRLVEVVLGRDEGRPSTVRSDEPLRFEAWVDMKSGSEGDLR